jgi:hypothetical protein
MVHDGTEATVVADSDENVEAPALPVTRPSRSPASRSIDKFLVDSSSTSDSRLRGAQQGTDICRFEPMLCFLAYRSLEASGLDALFSIDLDSILCPMADLSGGEHFLHRRPISLDPLAVPDQRQDLSPGSVGNRPQHYVHN